MPPGTELWQLQYLFEPAQERDAEGGKGKSLTIKLELESLGLDSVLGPVLLIEYLSLSLSLVNKGSKG